MNLERVRRADGTIPNQSIKNEDRETIKRRVAECPYAYRTIARRRFIQRLAMEYRVAVERIYEIVRGDV